MSQEFDLIVIGAGSGGVALSRRAARHGARVAVIENSRVGGTCVIRGCVPKKLLMYAAQYGELLREAAGFGWTVPETAFSMTRWADAKAAETARLEDVYRKLLADGDVTLIEGTARLLAPHRLAVGAQEFTAKHIVIATGARPARDVIPSLEDCPTSDDLLDLRELPASAVVLGGGYIAAEFASMLARLGVAVTMLYRDRLPLRGFDDDLRTRLATALAQAGIDLRPGCMASRIERLPAGWRLHLPAGETLDTPWTLNALGRRPNTAKLGLEAIGLELGKNGAVPVNAELATALPGLHAVGDVTDRKNLTPVAIAEGRWLADRLFAAGHDAPVALESIATAVFTLPPMASLGPTEAQCSAPTTVYEADFRPMREAFSGGKGRTYMKLLVDTASDRVRGIHMIGADAPEIVQSLAVAVTAGVTKAQFDRTIAIHPTAAEEFVLMRTPARNAGGATTDAPPT
ncbi:glutathione-disulfide reductase [Noviherbaspirillum sedimenti]|uniref:Glutathione-disulfide reductase n=1 Tax=Noviherbaspirillum sedimenti TaxID=2320865 RepID=A0A3A3GE64_9BURK|nr:glutathione-disulfide reductase [Noviherbaspirillum sedimenti]RJG00516.1 glutathione-disulfide reductase [Noviherbaspirillum sedimenti]